MRVAVIFVAVVVIATPSYASTSCMSKSEARSQFGNVHIYWHGPEHCWDASPGRHRYAARAQQHLHKQDVHEAKQAKWRDARSEIVPDNEPAPESQETVDQPASAPEVAPIGTTPVRVSPIRLASMMTDWSERWVDVNQVIPDHPIKAQAIPLATAALRQEADVTFVVRGLALVTFGSGLVLTFIALLVRSGTTSIGVPSAPLSFVGRGLQTIKHFVTILITHQAKAVCWRAVQWERFLDGFVSNGAYPAEIKWSPNSAGALISGDDVSPPFTVPSRLLAEKRQAASQAVSPRPSPNLRPEQADS